MRIQRLALIDMNVDINMMSHQTWRFLGKPNLDVSTDFMQISHNFVGECIGVLNTSLSINSHSESAKFFVMAPGHLDEEVVLGRHWMAQRRCYRGQASFYCPYQVTKS